MEDDKLLIEDIVFFFLIRIFFCFFIGVFMFNILLGLFVFFFFRMLLIFNCILCNFGFIIFFIFLILFCFIGISFFSDLNVFCFGFFSI